MIFDSPQHMPRLASRAYLAGAKGQPCSLRIPGVCNNDLSTVVPAHVRDRHAGRGIKASDISIADACSMCHRKFDGQLGAPLSREDWLFYALRGIQETLENRIARGILPFPADKPRPPKAPKPRKPKAERVAIAGSTTFPKGRKLQSRPMRRPERND